MKQLFLIAVLICGALAVSAAPAAEDSIDISGTWAFSVDLDNGGHGDPTFVFKQEKEKLTGSYDGPLGQYKVTGTVKEKTAVFGFDFESDGTTSKATYTGTIESATKMTGTVEFAGGPKGKWTATKK
ncbi:MAG TPA: hypothetical protein VFV34_26675 [Blastocatellia bacterium]|nr:hypothetical protein [Blastocatellia bacterium]